VNQLKNHGFAIIEVGRTLLSMLFEGGFFSNNDIEGIACCEVSKLLS
jgi:hypothetical protein